MHLDLIVTNARIRTGRPGRPRARRIGVWQGLVVGLDEEIDGLSAAEVVDAHGAFVMAGFNDVHAHSVWFGQTLAEIDLAGASDAASVYAALRRGPRQPAAHGWVIASQFDPLALSTPLTLSGLNAATGGRPLLIKHSSGHAYTVNGAALARIGVGDAPTSQPSGGAIVVDESGYATGLLEENAMRLVQDILLPDPVDDITAALHRAGAVYAREGVTSVTDAGIGGGWIGHSPREMAAYQDARDRGLLKTRTQTMIASDVLHVVPGGAREQAHVGLDVDIRCGLGDEWLQVGPMKMFVDGSLLGATAALTEPYCHHADRGYLQDAPEAMAETVRGAVAAGWAVALHAIGDRGLDVALEMLEQAETSSTSHAPMPHRIEHGGVVRPDQLSRIARLHASLVPQPMFIAAYGDGMAAHLGADRTLLSYPAASVLRAGIPLPGSSDRPVAEGAPLRVIQAFVQRLTQSGAEYAPQERLTVEQALDAYTSGSAVATGWGRRKGALATGMLADMVAMSDDPRTVPAERIGSIAVLGTWVGGIPTYRADDFR